MTSTGISSLWKNNEDSITAYEKFIAGEGNIFLMKGLFLVCRLSQKQL